MGRNARIGLIAIVAGLAAIWILARLMTLNRSDKPAPPQASPPQENSPSPGPSPIPLRAPARTAAQDHDRTAPPTASPASAAQPAPAGATAAAGPTANPRPAPPQARQRTPKPPIQNLLAREALAFVGADPDAEALWYAAINDPTLGAEERKDLIEDLNEDGFPDPHNVTADDLPLIISRIELIEQVWPDAMDEVNFEAFGEAYKDLVNMYLSLEGP